MQDDTQTIKQGSANLLLLAMGCLTLSFIGRHDQLSDSLAGLLLWSINWAESLGPQREEVSFSEIGILK
ncbi:hypothetical protein DCC85_01530 [Paenibacillus sp. CAA11]|nr:hypothetical protein DCC85_01530 [Paenibacillus sp. CAA11]